MHLLRARGRRVPIDLLGAGTLKVRAALCGLASRSLDLSSGVASGTMRVIDALETELIPADAFAAEFRRMLARLARIAAAEGDGHAGDYSATLRASADDLDPQPADIRTRTIRAVEDGPFAEDEIEEALRWI